MLNEYCAKHGREDDGWGYDVEVLMETEHFEFRIQKPKQPIMGRINII